LRNSISSSSYGYQCRHISKILKPIFVRILAA
jgi:hypothetical protein